MNSNKKLESKTKPATTNFNKNDRRNLFQLLISSDSCIWALQELQCGQHAFYSITIIIMCHLW